VSDSENTLFKLLESATEAIKKITPKPGDIIVWTLDFDSISPGNLDQLAQIIKNFKDKTGCDVVVIPSGNRIESMDKKSTIKRLKDVLSMLEGNDEEPKQIETKDEEISW
jgi:hypothetical protein